MCGTPQTDWSRFWSCACKITLTASVQTCTIILYVLNIECNDGILWHKIDMRPDVKTDFTFFVKVVDQWWAVSSRRLYMAVQKWLPAWEAAEENPVLHSFLKSESRQLCALTGTPYVIQRVTFIMAPITAALSHTKPASTETYRDGHRAQGHNCTCIQRQR